MHKKIIFDASSRQAARVLIDKNGHGAEKDSYYREVFMFNDGRDDWYTSHSWLDERKKLAGAQLLKELRDIDNRGPGNGTPNWHIGYGDTYRDDDCSRLGAVLNFEHKIKIIEEERIKYLGFSKPSTEFLDSATVKLVDTPHPSYAWKVVGDRFYI